MPIKENFYSSLTSKKISDREYEQVWNKFEMKIIKDYHNLCFQCDILLLAAVFEKLRNNSLKNYGLCPSYYLNAPALSWDWMLNMKKQSLSLVHIVTCTYCLKKTWEVAFLIFLIDIVKPTVSFEIFWPKTRIKTYYILRRK